MSCLVIHIHKLDGQLHGRAELASGQLHGRAELICAESGLPRLLVSPEVVWLTSSNNFSADFSVKSNVDWEIV